MKINDSTDKANSLYHDAAYWAGVSVTSFDIDDFMRSANFAQDALLVKIYKADGRFQFDDSNNTKLPIATTNLTAGATHIPLANSQLKIARLRIIDKQGNWKTLSPVDRRDKSDDELADTGEPDSYDKLGNNVFLLPIPDYDVDGGAELQFQRGSVYFTTADTTAQPGFPSIFHRFISLSAARDKVLADTIPNRLQVIDAELQRMDKDILEFFADRDRDDRPRFRTRPTLERY